MPRRCADGGLVPDASNVALVEQATLCLVNRERADRQIAPLVANAALRRAATGYSLEMISENFFADVSPTGTTVAERIARSGYRGGSIGAHPARVVRLAENLAIGCGPLATPESIVAAWMASPPHRANVLAGRFRASGIGVAIGAPGSVTGAWTGPSATYTQYLGATP